MTQHTKLIKEYRPTMHADVLHMWAKDARDALEAQAREIAELKAQESELCTLYELARAECKKLRKDAERFLALERIVHWEQERDMGPGGRYWMAVHVSSGNPTLREAIDAMKGQP